MSDTYSACNERYVNRKTIRELTSDMCVVDSSTGFVEVIAHDKSPRILDVAVFPPSVVCALVLALPRRSACTLASKPFKCVLNLFSGYLVRVSCHC